AGLGARSAASCRGLCGRGSSLGLRPGPVVRQYRLARARQRRYRRDQRPADSGLARLAGRVRARCAERPPARRRRPARRAEWLVDRGDRRHRGRRPLLVPDDRVSGRQGDGDRGRSSGGNVSARAPDLAGDLRHRLAHQVRLAWIAARESAGQLRPRRPGGRRSCPVERGPWGAGDDWHHRLPAPGQYPAAALGHRAADRKPDDL
ncbi:MAG: Acyl-phosphate:glycerol-3-phosphate O-acyltransferase PlsY (EC, partial [uncultured Thermomicrobiales bacterium]